MIYQMKMYEEYDSCRDQSNKYYESQDNALLPIFLQNAYLHEDGATDYMKEFQGSYNGIDTTAAAKQLIFKTEPENDTEEWKNKEAKDWTTSDVLHWIAHIAEREKFPYESVNATSFTVSGKELLTFSLKDFMIRDGKYGRILYDSLHKLTKYVDDMHLHYQNQIAKKEVNLQPLMTSSMLPKRLAPYTLNGLRDDTPYGLVPVPESYQNDMTHSSESYPFELDPVSEDREKSGEGYNGERKHSSDTSVSSDTEHSDFEVKKEPKKSVAGPAKRPPGRPPGVKTKKEKPEKKTGRLWEFIRDLLLDPQHCPSVICWENHDDGVFRFVKSEKVAKIWGDRKGNEKMNYEKLSRAMRYYYRSKVLQPVIGRRLVYKFGPTARGWKTENPNFRH